MCWCGFESYIYKSMPVTPAANINQIHKKTISLSEKKIFSIKQQIIWACIFSIKANTEGETPVGKHPTGVQKADLKKNKTKNLLFVASHYQDFTNNLLLSSKIHAFKCDRQCFSLTSNSEESNLLENITSDHKSDQINL